MYSSEHQFISAKSTWLYFDFFLFSLVVIYLNTTQICGVMCDVCRIWNASEWRERKEKKILLMAFAANALQRKWEEKKYWKIAYKLITTFFLHKLRFDFHFYLFSLLICHFRTSWCLKHRSSVPQTTASHLYNVRRADGQWAHTNEEWTLLGVLFSHSSSPSPSTLYRKMKQNIMRCGDRAITHTVAGERLWFGNRYQLRMWCVQKKKTSIDLTYWGRKRWRRFECRANQVVSEHRSFLSRGFISRARARTHKVLEHHFCSLSHILRSPSSHLLCPFVRFCENCADWLNGGE